MRVSAHEQNDKSQKFRKSEISRHTCPFPRPGPDKPEQAWTKARPCLGIYIHNFKIFIILKICTGQTTELYKGKKIFCDAYKCSNLARKMRIRLEATSVGIRPWF